MKSRTAAAVLCFVLASQAGAFARPQAVRLSSIALRARAVTCKVPAHLPQLHVVAYAVVEVLVDEAGRVRDAKVVSGHPLLHRSALQAASGWTFRPLKRRGKAVRFKGPLTLRFSYDADEMAKQCEGLSIAR
jgi:TonB family protein